MLSVQNVAAVGCSDCWDRRSLAVDRHIAGLHQTVRFERRIGHRATGCNLKEICDINMTLHTNHSPVVVGTDRHIVDCQIDRHLVDHIDLGHSLKMGD